MTPAELITALPTLIRVGPFDMALVKTSSHEVYSRRAVGEFRARQLQIAINADAPSKIDALDTLLHEVGHAIFWAYQIYDDDKEERTCAMMAIAWTQVHRDNPWLAGWIAKAVEPA
jgi:hypothetical protein